MVKAFIAGFFICHTTNILNCWFMGVHGILASLSFLFLMEILFLWTFLLLNLPIPFQIFHFYHFLSRQKQYLEILSYLRLENFYFGTVLWKILLSLSGLFCCTYTNTSAYICQYYLNYLFKLFFFFHYFCKFSENITHSKIYLLY